MKITIVMVLGLFGIGCVTPNIPYKAEFALSHNKHWASDGGMITKTLVIHNPTQKVVQVRVYCVDSNVYEGEAEHWFSILPESDVRVLVNVPTRYQVGEACLIADWNYYGERW